MNPNVITFFLPFDLYDSLCQNNLEMKIYCLIVRLDVISSSAGGISAVIEMKNSVGLSLSSIWLPLDGGLLLRPTKTYDDHPNPNPYPDPTLSALRSDGFRLTGIL